MSLSPSSAKSGDVGNMTLSNTGTPSHYSYTRTNTDQESSVKVNIQVETDGQIYLYFQTAANKPSRGYVIEGRHASTSMPLRSTLVDVGFVEGGTSVESSICFMLPTVLKWFVQSSFLCFGSGSFLKRPMGSSGTMASARSFHRHTD